MNKTRQDEIEFSDEEQGGECTDITEALNMIIPFGKYRNSTLQAMQKTKRTRGWCIWASKNAERLDSYQLSCIKLMLKDYHDKKKKRLQQLQDEKNNIE